MVCRRRRTSSRSARPIRATDCDPICQSRCDCGRCTYNGTGAVVRAAGRQEARRDLYAAAPTNARPGNICRNDCGDTDRRAATASAETAAASTTICGAEQDCEIFLNDALGNPTEMAVCGPPVQTCNPVGDSNDCGCTRRSAATSGQHRWHRVRLQGHRSAGGDVRSVQFLHSRFSLRQAGRERHRDLREDLPHRRNGLRAPAPARRIGGGTFGFCMP